MENKFPKVIVLAGGKGTRLPVAAKDIPKALVKIQGKPLLRHQLEMLKKQGFSDIRFSLGFRADQIIEYIIDALGGKYEYVIEDEPLGTGGAIKKASSDLNDDFMVLNGDILADIDLISFWRHHQDMKNRENTQEIGTITVWPCPDCRDFGLIKLTEHRVNEFLEKPAEQCEGLINAGFYILSPRIFKEHPEISFSIERSVFPKLAQENKLFAFIHKGKWVDVGTEERLRSANNG